MCRRVLLGLASVQNMCMPQNALEFCVYARSPCRPIWTDQKTGKFLCHRLRLAWRYAAQPQKERSRPVFWCNELFYDTCLCRIQAGFSGKIRGAEDDCAILFLELCMCHLLGDLKQNRVVYVPLAWRFETEPVLTKK